jgi:anthranilate phosphoribosyltransferase
LAFIHLASLDDLHTRKLICAKSNSYRILIALAEGDVYAVAKMAADAVIAALNGTKGSTYDALVYSSAIALWHLQKCDDMKTAADKVREVLDNGSALQHFNAAP